MGFLARGSLFFNEKTRLTCVCAFFVVTSRAPTSFVHAHSPTSKLQLRYAAHTQNSLEIFTKKGLHLIICYPIPHSQASLNEYCTPSEIDNSIFFCKNFSFFLRMCIFCCNFARNLVLCLYVYQSIQAINTNYYQ